MYKNKKAAPPASLLFHQNKTALVANINHQLADSFDASNWWINNSIINLSQANSQNENNWLSAAENGPDS